MMKLLRKYNKQLLAVFMTLLMIVFLGGSALEGMLNPSMNRVVATSSLGDITLADQQVAQQTTSLLESLGMDWRRPFGGSAEPLQETHWILLLRESERLGTRTDIATVRSWFTPEQVDQFARRMQIRPDRILQAAADFSSVQRTAAAVGSAAAPSEAETTAAARQALEQVQIRTVLIPAEAFVDDAYQPTEEEMAEHFRKYRDKPRGEGLAFGYFQEAAVKVQYIEINRDAIAANLNVPDLARLAKTYYEENRTTDPAFRRPPDEIQPLYGLEGPPQDPYLSWEEARGAAEEAARKAQADAAVDRLANRILQHTAEVWFEAERGEDGYKVAPAYVADSDYLRELTDRLSSHPEAVSVETTDFFTLDDATEVAKIGSAAFRPPQGAPRTFSALVADSEAFVSTVPEDANTGDFIAMFQTCPVPVSDPETGNVYIFRPIDARPGRPAESLDEVRDRVVEDLRLLHGFRTAKARAESLRGCLLADPEPSLQEAFETDLELAELAETVTGIGYFEPSPFARVPRFQAGQRRPENGVFVGGGVGRLSNDVVDQCFALETTFDKTAVMKMPERALVLVVEWAQTLAPDVDEFNQLREQLVNQLAVSRRFDAMSAWLDPENIQARNRFELVTQ